MTGVCSHSGGATHIQHVADARLRLGQAEQEAPGSFHQRGGRVHVVPAEVVQQALQQGEEGARGRQPELGQLRQVARVAQPRLQRALRRVSARLRRRRAFSLEPAREALQGG